MTAISFLTPGIYALEPQAFGIELLFDALQNSGVKYDNGVAFVKVCGPLSYAHPIAPTYSGVLERVREALASDAHTVVLHLDSPGGDVAGALDAGRAIRALASASDKRLIGYTDSKACSSAYALISGCPEVSVSSTGTLGSVGVICTLASLAAAEKAAGMKFALVTSGKRKADGNPHAPLTEEVIAAAQVGVDVMADEFFRLVKEHRGIDAQPLEAGTFVGFEAVTKGLADKVESYQELCARLSVAPGAAVPSLSTAASSESQAKTKMADKDSDKKDDLRASLAKAAESDDKDESARAKRALKAYDSKAEGDEDDEKKKDEEAKSKAKAEAAAVAAQATAAELAAQLQAVSSRLASFEAKAAAEERQAFFASRPDLAPELVKSLANTPFDQVKAIVGAIPVGVARAGNPLAETTQVVRAAGEGGSSASPLDPATAQWMREKMGLVKYETQVVESPYKLSFPSAPKGVV